jgi:hypothetical protein
LGLRLFPVVDIGRHRPIAVSSDRAFTLKRFVKAALAGVHVPRLAPFTRATSRRGFEIRSRSHAMSGANRPSGPATRKSLDLADQIERDEMENNLPDALNEVDDEDDLQDEADSNRAPGS